VGAFTELWPEMLASAQDAAGTGALCWLSNTSVTISDWEGGNVGEGVETGEGVGGGGRRR